MDADGTSSATDGDTPDDDLMHFSEHHQLHLDPSLAPPAVDAEGLPEVPNYQLQPPSLLGSADDQTGSAPAQGFNPHVLDPAVARDFLAHEPPPWLPRATSPGSDPGGGQAPASGDEPAHLDVGPLHITAHTTEGYGIHPVSGGPTVDVGVGPQEHPYDPHNPLSDWQFSFHPIVGSEPPDPHDAQNPPGGDDNH